ncbi:DUF4344 domain-containing metallopeptidase [Devosia algicola]|uniref:DUF4344 domain-containing metallopeptidase n=1 Tax=Devosia algicola TaxID=3026418 RepID=A0ABY7YQW3_9HYPH|nr:DUF4344 domain-containing metallopeptidase [Devosia algicola]WDR03577.1 DUF4344 domain-containing metallopeptidase [Devosia algicola]
MRIWGTRLILVAFLTLGALSSLATASALPLTPQRLALRFAANNSLFVLYHEVAHLLFDQLNVPILGREEDAADNLATWTMLNQHNGKSDQALDDAAYGWILTGLAYNSGAAESDFYAAHSLDRQRAYQIVCLMVGNNEKRFHKIADGYGMDIIRQAHLCRRLPKDQPQHEGGICQSQREKPSNYQGQCDL